MCDKYANSQHIYTDGSKIDTKTGCGFTTNDNNYMYRLIDNASIFSAELTAILNAIKHSPEKSSKNVFTILLIQNQLYSNLKSWGSLKTDKKGRIIERMPMIGC